MPISVKICGLKTSAHAAAAANAGADMLGFVFFPPSPRNLTINDAAALEPQLPMGPTRVGVFVGAGDALIAGAVKALKLDALQLHGQESLARVKAIKAKFGLKIIKAISIENATDFEDIEDFTPHVDMFLFDAKPPKGAALPGGNAISFSWGLMQHYSLDVPWLLAGGLSLENLDQAIAESGAKAVDISSGVEKKSGEKDIGLIEAFLERAKML